MVDFAVIARREVERRLVDAGALDFDRMIVWTRDLLARDATVRRTLQRRIRTLIVDEFQDVDPAQREIAYLLGAPEEQRPETTRLMLVGDPKQSIYRFRRADVTVWRSVEQEFEEREAGPSGDAGGKLPLGAGDRRLRGRVGGEGARSADQGVGNGRSTR